MLNPSKKKKKVYEEYKEIIKNVQYTGKEQLTKTVSEEAQILNLKHKDFVIYFKFVQPDKGNYAQRTKGDHENDDSSNRDYQ